MSSATPKLNRDEILAKVQAGESLSDANLSGANLSDAYLRDANLSDANLSYAYLRDANLSDANLSDANLSDAYLRDANLSYANLSGANLSGANLRGANLSGANLSGANLSGANLPTGEPWDQYLREVVPALCTAGGVSLAEVAKHFECHDWTNCPMAAAFHAEDLAGVPILFRPRAEQFIHFFDNNLIEAVVADDGAVTFRSPVAVQAKAPS